VAQLFGRLLFGRGIKQRLVIAFSVFILLVMLMAAMGTWRLFELNGATTSMSTRANTASRIERLLGDWYAEAKANAVRAVVLTSSDDPELKRVLTPQLAAATQQISQVQKELEQLVTGAQAKALLNDAVIKRNSYLALRGTALEKKQAGQTEEALALLNGSMLPAGDAYLGAIRSLVEHYGTTQLQKDSAEAAATAETGRNLLIGAGAAAVLFGILFAWRITSAVARPLRKAASVAAQVADGDLTVQLEAWEVNETGHLLQALAHMTDSLRSLLAEVSAGAHTVWDTSAQIAQGNLDLSQRTEEQASTLEETASSMEELTATVGQNAQSARQASQLAVSASDVAQKGGKVVDQVLGTMDEILDASKKIGAITGVIDSIAFQTNILALNAAVEAARAGEQGRGFAVVAAEVRNLAQRSAAAAKEIRALIGDTVQKVQAGSSLADAAGHTMVEVVSSVKKVSDLIAEIAAASHEQSSGIAQVNTALGQMDQVVQQNASLVEEATGATESMKEQADWLLQLVSRFKLGGEQRAMEPSRQAAPRDSNWGRIGCRDGGSNRGRIGIQESAAAGARGAVRNSAPTPIALVEGAKPFSGKTVDGTVNGVRARFRTRPPPPSTPSS